MDDIGNIVYLLLILLSVVFSAFRKKKKPVAPPPQKNKKRPAFDPMEEFQTILEKYTGEQSIEKVEKETDVEIIEEEVAPLNIEDEVTNPYMQHLEDERFKEAEPQTFSDEEIYSDDFRDVAPETNTDNSELITSNFFEEQESPITSSRKVKKILKAFNARDAIIYSAIINRPYK